MAKIAIFGKAKSIPHYDIASHIKKMLYSISLSADTIKREAGQKTYVDWRLQNHAIRCVYPAAEWRFALPNLKSISGNAIGPFEGDMR